MHTGLITAPNLVPLAPSKINVPQVTSFRPKLIASLASPRSSAIKAANVSNDNDTASTVDYNSQISVFPAEACETVGGDACLADIYPEVRLPPEPRNKTPRLESENVVREYLEYNEPKTVFQGEACDDLGGIFCEHEYQKGVY